MLDLSAYYIRFSFYLFNSPTHTEFYTLSLHDALPILIEERRDFESKRFAAIEKFSNRPDLWDEWRKLYREDSPDAHENAKQFYEENKEAMLEGTRSVWDGYWAE